MQLVGNAPPKTRLGGSFGKRAFRELGEYFGNSRRAWAAAGQPVRTAKRKGKL